MAALDDVEHISMGRDYARSMYVEALGLLNSALRDPVRSTTDESLIAVAMLGYYENHVCDSRESIQSWKAHISGATQLLKLRGPAQFRTAIGRMLLEYEIARPADDLMKVCFDFATVCAQIEKRTIPDSAALEAINDIDRRMLQWSIDNLTFSGTRWYYTSVEVTDSPHVWNGVVHFYAAHPAPGVWNTFRCIRILVTRSQEWLCCRFPFSDAERAEQTAYFRKVRRQMMDEICAGTPPALGHASPAYKSPAVPISAYGAIWPLFFAGTCALERIGTTKWEAFENPPNTLSTQTSSAASAQASWLLGRLDYISKVVGLRWAAGIAAVLRGDFTLHTDMVPLEGAQVGSTPDWVRKVQRSGRGPKVLLEPEGRERPGSGGPIWLGRDVAGNGQVG